MAEKSLMEVAALWALPIQRKDFAGRNHDPFGGCVQEQCSGQCRLRWSLHPLVLLNHEMSLGFLRKDSAGETPCDGTCQWVACF